MRQQTIDKIPKIVAYMMSIFIAIGILKLPVAQELITLVASIKYFGIFIAGALFTYSTTTLPAIAIFARAAETLNPYLLIPIGATGATVGNLIIRKYVHKIAKKQIKKSRKYLKQKKWIHRLDIILPSIMLVVLATPLPDEFVAALSYVSKYSTKKYMLICFISKLIGIWLIFVTANLL